MIIALKTVVKNIGLLTIVLFITIGAAAQFPQRKAIMGMHGKIGNGGIIIDTVAPGTTFALAGLKKGDVVMGINDQPTPNFG